MTEQEAVLELLSKLLDEFPFIPERDRMVKDGRLRAWVVAQRANYPELDIERLAEAVVGAETRPDHFDQLTDEAIAAIADGTGWVVVDVPPPQVSADPKVASELARSRLEAIRQGNRVAYLYTHKFQIKINQPTHAKSFSVTAEQAAKLIAAGAQWVGPDYYKPAT